MTPDTPAAQAPFVTSSDAPLAPTSSARSAPATASTDSPRPIDIVRAALASHGLQDRIHEFDVDVPTAADAAQQLGCEVGAIANSLVFRAGDEPVLVMASGAHRVDVAVVGPAFGVERLRSANAKVVLTATGQQVGGCAPVGHPAPLRTVVDTDLARYERLWAGAGEKHAMLWVTYEELVSITNGTPAAVV